MFVYLFLVLILLAALSLIGSYYYWARRQGDILGLKKALGMSILAVMLPKEIKEEDRAKKMDEIIAPMETVLKNLHSLRETDRGVYFTLEIIAHQGLIGFYLGVPKKFVGAIEKQLTAQYPEAVVEEVTDPNIFAKEGRVAAAQLALAKEDFLPLPTYEVLESDGLNALANALSRLSPESEGAAVQLVIKPIGNFWQRQGRSRARAMAQGKGGRGFWRELAYNLLTLGGGEKEKKERIELTPAQQEKIKAIEQKAAEPGFAVQVRLVASAPDDAAAQMQLNHILSSFAQFGSPESNFFKKLNVPPGRVITSYILRDGGGTGRSAILNTEELATLFHPPHGRLETPNILWLKAKRLAAPDNLPAEGIVLGKNVFRGEERVVRMKEDDRRRHFYVIGKTGTGKTTWMQNMALQDIMAGKGVAVIDPHGEMIDWLLARIPKERVDDIIHFYPPDTDRPLGLNMLEADNATERDMVVSEMIAIFYKLFDPHQTAQIIGPMFEHWMRNAMLAILADTETGATLVEIPRMFTDEEFRNQKIEKVTDLTVRDFWLREFPQSLRGQAGSDMLPYVISKLGRFIGNEMMRNIIGQSKSAFDLREVMDKKKILLVNLAKGITGEINSSLLGFILVSKLQMAALSRANVPEKERPDFYLYIDEFQNFTTDSIETILSEARKYRLNLIVAHQFMDQLEEGIRNAVLGNVGTMMAFRVGAKDAEIMAKELGTPVSEQDLLNIENRRAYLKLMIDGAASKPFTLHTLSPLGEENPKVAKALKQLSRIKFGHDRRLVEAELKERGRLEMGYGGKSFTGGENEGSMM